MDNGNRSKGFERISRYINAACFADNIEFSATLGSNFDKKQVTNSASLQSSFLIECFNLKAAVESQSKGNAFALQALNDMPSRPEEELDPITLHNQAVLSVHAEPSESFEKLHFLIEENMAPNETFQNLVLAYFHHDHDEFASNLMSTKPELLLDLEALDKDFLECYSLGRLNPDEAIRKLDLAEINLDALMREQRTELQQAEEIADEQQIRFVENELELLSEKLFSYPIFFIIVGSCQLGCSRLDYTGTNRNLSMLRKFSKMVPCFSGKKNVGT